MKNLIKNIHYGSLKTDPSSGGKVTCGSEANTQIKETGKKNKTESQGGRIHGKEEWIVRERGTE